VERAANLLGASSGGLYLTEQELHKVRCVVSYKTKSDFTGTLLDFGDGAAGIVAETGQPLIIDDYSKWTGRARVYEQGHPFQAVMSAPMLWQGKVSGVIHLLRDDDSKKFTQEELNLLILFANHAAVAVENARLFSLLDKELTERKRTEEKLQEANKRLEEQLEEIKILQDYLREQAIRDSLTGLYNRRYLDETMERELARARRENYSVSVIMIDIDHFKNFNDTYGHQAGDKVLTALSGLLRSGVRQGDIACRYGGEEFLVIMPGVDEVDAKRRAEAIRSSFNGLRVNYGEAELSVSISIGVAFYPQHGNDMNEIVKAADAALYEAKQSGRNLVHIFRSA
jgi:diguanylate cyclase (GGDEF)-like protein